MARLKLDFTGDLSAPGSLRWQWSLLHVGEGHTHECGDIQWLRGSQAYAWVFIAMALEANHAHFPRLLADEGPARTVRQGMYTAVGWRNLIFGCCEFKLFTRERVKTSGRVHFYVKSSMLLPTDIQVFVNDKLILDPETLTQMADAIGQQWESSASRRNGGCGDEPLDTPSALVDRIQQANAAGLFGCDLLPEQLAAPGDEGAEGVIFTKPGVPIDGEVLENIIGRLVNVCRIRQMRLYDGASIEGRDIFEQQMIGRTRLGLPDFSTEERNKVSAIYDTDEFQAHFGRRYRPQMIVPGLELMRKHSLDGRELTELWNTGRNQYFHRDTIYGINKIGYQKSTYAVRLGKIEKQPVYIVVNGYLPGYKALLEDTGCRVVAFDVVSFQPWIDLRDKVVGGQSNPQDCEPNSIRFDAKQGHIPGLNPVSVNGQLNVCHCSAALIEGMYELGVWFGRGLKETRMGRRLSEHGFTEKEIRNMSETRIVQLSEATRGDDTIHRLLFEMMKDKVRADVRIAKPGVQEQLVMELAEHWNVPTSRAADHPAVLRFAQNGAYLKIAHHDYYCEMIRAGVAGLNGSDTFNQVAKALQRKRSGADGACWRDCILAEALRIAASDLMFMDCPAYDHVKGRELLMARLLSGLEEQAWDCAERTMGNLKKDLAAAGDNASPSKGISLAKSAPWATFMRAIGTQRQPRLDMPGEIAGIILCGGRSTRMSSTIPKPLLPLGRYTMVEIVAAALRQSGVADQFAAVGFRHDVVVPAICDIAKPMVCEELAGLGFRVATCLELLQSFEGLVVLAYCDMPLLNPARIRQLIGRVMNERGRNVFGLLTTTGASGLSGFIEGGDSGSIRRIFQSRMTHVDPRQFPLRDVGLYVFYNTPQFRKCLGRITNGNPRGEFIFADVVEFLANDKWKIVTVEEDARRAAGINSASDLLVQAATASLPTDDHSLNTLDLPASADFHSPPHASQIRARLQSNYRLHCPEFDNETLLRTFRSHSGPLYFYHWWNKECSA